MTVQFRHRQYEDGDAEAINALYARITGRSRSLRQYCWQWIEAPGGKGDIWLIEAVDARGKTELIGHHGIMPIRFSRGADDLLFGKTENTMLLPDFRNKILYPRFERRFASVYESRFHALFSTAGHTGAIRQRRAMGYEFPVEWIHVRMPVDLYAEFFFAYELLRLRLTGSEPAGGQHVDVNPTVFRADHGNMRVLDDSQAPKDRFFESFWSDVRSHYGVTPSRNHADLNWRFWSNPNAKYITLILDNDQYGRGYVVVQLASTSRTSAVIEDIVPTHAEPQAFYYLLTATLASLRHAGIRWVNFSTTTESTAKGAIAAGIVRRNLTALKAVTFFRGVAPDPMPRKVTALGKDRELSTNDWYVTPLIFEGRRFR